MQLDLFVREILERVSRKPTHAEVNASHSADTIGAGKVRRPFMYRGFPHVNCGGHFHGKRHECDAIELIPIEKFEGTPTTYEKKLSIRGGDYARSDPNGFYYGMRCKNGKDYVLGRVTARLVFENDELTQEIPWEETERGKANKR